MCALKIMRGAKIIVPEALSGCETLLSSASSAHSFFDGYDNPHGTALASHWARELSKETDGKRSMWLLFFLSLSSFEKDDYLLK